jgi:hypothetical protein
MEPLILFPTSLSGPSFPVANLDTDLQSPSLPAEEGFDALIQSVLQKKSLQPDGRSVAPSLLAMFGYLMPSLLNPDPSMLV